MDEGTKLLEDTRALLLKRPAYVTLQRVATDVEVSIAWLRLFATGKASNPGIVTVGKLNAYLKDLK